MKALYQALLKAQGKFPVITKNKTAQVPTKSGGKYSYSYADLGSVVDGISPVLAANNLGIFHKGEGDTLTTVLFHAESGESISSTFKMPMSEDPQDMGGVITYYRRYAICALVGVVTEDDADASTSSRGAKPASKPAAKPSFPDQTPSTAAQSNSPGDFKIPFGKFEGMLIKNIDMSYVKNDYDYLANRKNLSGNGLKYFNALEAFLKEKGEFDMPLSSQEIPF